jgi:hypothetical protein
MHGIHIDVEHEQVWWSGINDDGKDFTYTQHWGERSFTFECKSGRLRGLVNGEECFSASTGIRVVTGLDGAPVKIVGIHPEAQKVSLRAGARRWELTVEANQSFDLTSEEPEASRTAPFDFEYRISNKE